MNDYVEFTGKTLDEAIKEACAFFAAQREKLEIEIVNDAKTGIFGLVGAKKATIRARRAQLEKLDLGREDVQQKSQKPEKPGAERGKNAQQDNGNRERKGPRSAPAETSTPSAGLPLPVPGDRSLPAIPPTSEIRTYSPGALAKTEAKAPLADAARGEAEPDADTAAAGQRGNRNRRDKTPRGVLSSDGDRRQAEKRQPQADGMDRNKKLPQSGRENRHNDRRASSPRHNDGNEARRTPSAACQNENDVFTSQDAELANDFQDHLPHVSLADLPQEDLRQSVIDAMRKLTGPIAGDFEAEYELTEGRVSLHLNCGENCGLLIGREGQTLSALQYLVSCIASRRMGATVRVQIDAGDYRGKQDEKLRELAASLAEKVRTSHKPQSTRPLSAYHRRIIHLALHDDPDVQTHSKGEGGMKRVVVVPRRKKSSEEQ